jgi:hypothetical protein
METALHSSLNFSDNAYAGTIKGKVQRTKLYPQASSFNPSSDIRIKLPANELASYADIAHRCYLQFTLTPVGNNLVLNREGAVSVFNNCLIQTPSQTICDINDYSNLVATCKDIQSDQLHKGNIGSLQSGETTSNIGVTLTAGTAYTFSVPFCQLSPLATANSYIPLFSREEIEIVLTLGDINSYGRWAGAPTSAVINNVELVLDVIKLDAQSQALVDAACGGVYNINCMGVNSSRKTLANGTTNFETQVDSNVNFLDKILVTFRRSDAQDAQSAYQTARVNPSLTSLQFSVNSKNYPSNPVRGAVNQSSEFLSETLNAFNMLGHNNAPSSLNALGSVTTVEVGGLPTASPYNFIEGDAGAATNAAGSNSGSFCVALNLSSLNEDTDELYNGISTVGASCVLKTQHSAMANDVVQNVYCFYNQKLILDMNQDQTFMVVV